MKILVLNSGSSSIKFQLLDTGSRTVMCKGLVERIGLEDAIFNYQVAGSEKLRQVQPIPDHTAGIKLVLETLTSPTRGVISSLDEIAAVGHRIVHGGEKIQHSLLLCEQSLRLIDECTPLAPLHNPANLMGVYAIQKLLPGVPNVGVFDTAFHATMPKPAYIYALDYKYYEQHGIRRFGFHGTSHQYVAMRAAEILGRRLDDFNCITCHLGNGSSLTAVRGGKSVDTSLGFGTCCGVPMGTRSGDVDPAVLMHLITELGMTAQQVCDLIYKGSGLKGISGVSHDMRDVEEAAAKGNERAELALEIFAHGVRKYIAALATSLGDRVDAVIFTAGIGENGSEIRARICRGLGFMGVWVDPQRNQVRGKEAIISPDGAPVTVMVVPTNEELMIALDTEAIVKAARA